MFRPTFFGSTTCSQHAMSVLFVKHVRYSSIVYDYDGALVWCNIERVLIDVEHDVAGVFDIFQICRADRFDYVGTVDLYHDTPPHR
jgi:hypothetical protein